MGLDLAPDVVAALALGGAVASGVLLVVVLVLLLRLSALRRDRATALGDGSDVFEAVRDLRDGLATLREDLGTVHGNTEKLRDLHREAITRVGVVRYDAFDDMGGQLSFSAALLDESGDGVVVSAINGRTETRAYGKPVAGGTSDHSLSDEERAAIDGALAGRSTPTLASPGTRRRRRSS